MTAAAGQGSASASPAETRSRLPRRLRAAAVLLVLAVMAAAAGDSAAQEDSDNQPVMPTQVGAVVYTDGKPSDGGIRWRCSTATCFWRDGYGQIVEVVDGEPTSRVLNQGNASGWYRVSRPQVVACVQDGPFNGGGEDIGVCASRLPSRYDPGNATAGLDSLWEYAGAEALIQTFAAVRHHNPFRCEVSPPGTTCAFPEAALPYADGPRPGLVLPVARAAGSDSGQWGIFYGPDEPTLWTADERHPHGWNHRQTLSVPRDTVVLTYCMIVLPSVSHCATNAASGPEQPPWGYEGNNHPTHRLDRPLTDPPTFRCYRRSGLVYPDGLSAAAQRAGHYRQAEFRGWPVWVAWDHADLHDDGMYDRYGRLLDADRKPTDKFCDDTDEDRYIPKHSECEWIYRGEGRYQAFGPDGDPPAYVYTRDVYDDDDNLIGGPGDWVQLGGKHPPGQALEVAGDMSSLIEGDDRAFRPDWDTRSMHSYPKIAYDQHGNNRHSHHQTLFGQHKISA